MNRRRSILEYKPLTPKFFGDKSEWLPEWFDSEFMSVMLNRVYFSSF